MSWSEPEEKSPNFYIGWLEDQSCEGESDLCFAPSLAIQAASQIKFPKSTPTSTKLTAKIITSSNNGNSYFTWHNINNG